MQVTSLLNRDTACPIDAPVSPPTESTGRLQQIFLGFLFIANAYIVEWFFPRGSGVAGISAFIGAIILAAPILWTSARDLMRGQVSINELVSLAVLASFATGDYRTVGIVSFFMLLGETIETRTAAGARASIESLIQLTPGKARRVTAKGEEEIPTHQLAVGDLVRVRPGDNIPADGTVTSGASTINQASITGESLPVDRKPGDEVFAGTINLTGVMELRVTRAGEDTTLGRVRELILAAEQTKLPIMRLMDQYMGYYTPLVLTLGALVWVFTKDLNRVISMLVVACPCAFVLATPSAMVAALSAAARLGILIKNIADLELAARLNAFIFDKTGTLTTGKLAVTRLAPAEGIGASVLLQLAASAEKYSNHPVAKALQTVAAEAKVPLAEPHDFAETAGRGVRARVKDSDVLVGRAQWLRENGVAEHSLKPADLDEAEGYSLLFVARDGRFIGWIGFQDQRRSEAAQALAELHAAGVKRIAMVTGDRQPVAARIAREVGCEEIAAECLPQDKVAFVREVKERGYRVAVVGDGVNDAPALASGDIGIAMGAAGSEVAIHSATIALMNNDLRRLPFLVKLSHGTRRVINQNFLIGVLFIIGGLVLATLGYLNPVIAAIMHNAGSLMVVFNSARLVRQGEELDSVTVPGVSPESSAPPTTIDLKPQTA
jgi:Zn2+/Cd2+-exporting ATPase